MLVSPEQILPEKGTTEASDPFAKAPPGYSFTVDNSNFPWGRPAEEANPDKVLDGALDFLEIPSSQDQIKKLLIAGVSIESIIEGYIFHGFQEGKFSLDVGLLIKAPLAIYLANMAEEEELPYRLFEKDDPFEQGGMDDRGFLELMKVNNPSMFSHLKEILNEQIRSGQTLPPDRESIGEKE